MKSARSKKLGSCDATSSAARGPSPRTVEDQNSDTVAYGVFKGMGDLLAAAPVIIAELNTGVRVILFAYAAVTQLIDLLDFGDNRDSLRVVIFPGKRSILRLCKFVFEASHLAPDFIWISPHSPAAARSWKVPVFFWLMKTLSWRRARLGGAASERLSRLFDIRVPVDRRLPLADREAAAYAMARPNCERGRMRVRFKGSIHARVYLDPEFDVLIHPGANAENRKWPAAHFVRLIQMLPSTYRVGIVGLPNDLAPIQSILPSCIHVQWIVGSLEDAIISIAKTRVLLSMDSGTAFFAEVLGIPTVALYGPVDPASVLGAGGCISAVYKKSCPFQPCGNSSCSQPENICLTSIEPERVAAALLLRAGG
jgi:heptosyltransferase II